MRSRPGALKSLGMECSEDLWCSLECTPPCQGGGREFKSRQVRSKYAGSTGMPRGGRVAQLAERAPEKREVTGSTPVPTTSRKP